MSDQHAQPGFRRSDRHTKKTQRSAARGAAPGVRAETPGAPVAPAPKWPRRRILRWVANLMVLAGVLLLAYPLGTWAYTWFEQRELRQELAAQNPGLAAAQAAFESGDMISAAPPGAAPGSGGPGGTPGSAIDPAEAERLAQLAAFEAAATAYAAEVGWKTGTPIGRVVVPSIGVDVVMLEGTEDEGGDLREGPGHWPETPFPGLGGNFVVSGHRTTYGAPFRKLDKLRVGDEIILILPYGLAKYTVTNTMIVRPREVASVASAGREQVSLAACHPIFSARQRIVVQGDLVAFKVVQDGGPATPD